MSGMGGISNIVEVAAKHSDDVDQCARFPRESIAALRDEGLLAACAQPEFGGPGLRVSELVAIAKALARSCASTAMTWSMHQGQLISMCRFSGEGGELRDLTVEAIAKQWLIASVTSEPGTGGDLRSSQAALTPVSGHVSSLRLVKQASAVSYGAAADLLLVTARRSAASASADQVLVAIRPGQAEVEQTGPWSPLGMRGTCSPAFRITATVDAGQVFAADFADIAADAMVPLTQLLWAATWFGLAAEALDRAVRFSRRRMAGASGRKAQPALAEARWRLAGIEAQLGDVTARTQEFFDAARQSTVSLAVRTNALKLSVSETALAIALLALRVCGMAGYSEQGPFSLARIIRDLMSSVIMISNDRLLENTAQLMLMERPGGQ